jgi:DNA-binding transcriptional regulator YdaS (Cro superfamily)
MKLSDYLSERGSRAALAKKLGVAPSMVTQWANGDRDVPPSRCASIEEATGGKVTRRDLRDDWITYWPELERRSKNRTYARG